MQFGIELSDELIYKSYYELKEWMIRKGISDFVDRDQFIEVVVGVLKIVESETDARLLEDPLFVEKSLKEHAWLWNLYSFFRDYVTSENVKAVVDSPTTKAIDRYLNSVMINNPLLLDYKVHRDVDFAISDYEALTGNSSEVKIESPTFTEELEGETPLGGELRLTAPYKKDYEL